MIHTHAEQGHFVSAPARLHLGFADLNGGLGRRFGSIGLAIGGLDAEVWAAPAAALRLEGLARERVEPIARRLLALAGGARGLHLVTHALPPAHVGLGSGTQLALALAAAGAGALDLAHSARELAVLVGRGERSGIGIAAFEAGGFIVDGGRGPASTTPPVLARLNFPAAWRCVLLFDDHAQGLSGAPERAAFATLPTMSATRAGRLARTVLMGLLPAVAEEDFRAFSVHLAQIQILIGGYFAPKQGGIYTSARVGAALLELSRTFGLPGIGQSSWGPTGFIFTPDPSVAQAVAAACGQWVSAGLRCQIVTATNVGARRTRGVQPPAGEGQTQWPQPVRPRV